MTAPEMHVLVHRLERLVLLHSTLHHESACAGVPDCRLCDGLWRLLARYLLPQGRG